MPLISSGNRLREDCWRSIIRQAPCVLLAVGLSLSGSGCVGEAYPRPRLDTRARVNLSAVKPPAGDNWPLPPAEIEAVFADEALELRALEPTERGTMENYRATVYSPRYRRRLEVKWKPAPVGDAEGFNNVPRKEIAAYVVQKWVLDDVDLVVPTAAVHCFALGAYRRLVPQAEPTIEGTQCVAGVLSVWMKNSRHPEPIYEPDRFATDSVYAYHVANANLVTYLIDHRDSRANNFLEANDAKNRRLFMVDNGIAFGATIYDVTETNWNQVHVPALRSDAIERLRHVTMGDVDQLAVLANLRVNSDGVLVPATGDPLIDPDEGSRVSPGWLQLGLTADEIAAVDARIRLLLQQVDEGDIVLF